MGRTKRLIGYVILLLVSALFLYYGNQIICKQVDRGLVTDREEELDTMVFARVIRIDSTEQNEQDGSKTIHFTARTLWNADNAVEYDCEQLIYDNYKAKIAEVKSGDAVILQSVGNGEENAWIFQDYFRFDKIMILGAMLAVFILVLGGRKGFHTLVTLTITCLAIFMVFIPSIGAGWNIYVSCTVICIFIICMSTWILNGFNGKSKTAILGCIGGVVFSGIITGVMDNVMKMTGYMNEDTFHMVDLFGGQQNIDMKAVVFAMIIIGALGGTMDVSISITSSVFEMYSDVGPVSKYKIIKSGLNIGRDIMGTMMNTLILAYIGSSLLVVLLYYGGQYPLLNLFNKEEIVFEMSSSLIGSLGMVLTIPFTTLIAAFQLSKQAIKADKNG